MHTGQHHSTQLSIPSPWRQLALHNTALMEPTSPSRFICSAGWEERNEAAGSSSSSSNHSSRSLRGRPSTNTDSRTRGHRVPSSRRAQDICKNSAGRAERSTSVAQTGTNALWVRSGCGQHGTPTLRGVHCRWTPRNGGLGSTLVALCKTPTEVRSTQQC